MNCECSWQVCFSEWMRSFLNLHLPDTSVSTIEMQLQHISG